MTIFLEALNLNEGQVFSVDVGGLPGGSLKLRSVDGVAIGDINAAQFVITDGTLNIKSSADLVAPEITGGLTTDFININATGSLSAFAASQLALNNGTLGIKTGPTVITTTTLGSRMIISANDVSVPTVVNANSNTLLHIIGKDGATSGLEFDAYGGVPVVRYRRMNGTALVPTAIVTGNVLGQFNTGGYNGTAAAAGPVVQGRAIENWTTATNGSALDFQVGISGTLTPQNVLQLSGAAGTGVTTNRVPASTSYANDAAAAIGGVAVGELYRNGSVIQCRIA